MHDLVIRNGLLVDGTGAPPRQADVAIDGDRIVGSARSTAAPPAPSTPTAAW
jgi:N-acyl-D-aspartate/D-glutamate deacylase